MKNPCANPKLPWILRDVRDASERLWRKSLRGGFQPAPRSHSGRAGWFAEREPNRLLLFDENR